MAAGTQFVLDVNKKNKNMASEYICKTQKASISLKVCWNKKDLKCFEIKSTEFR